MRIILSPAKKMKEIEVLEPLGLPVFLEQTREILTWLRNKTESELKVLWGCNDKIAAQNVERIAKMDLGKAATPAILSYEGIAYQYMAPSVFEEQQLAYVQEHLRILSAFYGVLKPMDGVHPYRLEMQAKAAILGHKDLYDYWGEKLYREVRDASGVIINLASKEYSRCIERSLGPADRFLTCEFVEEVNGKMVTKGTYAKMARGEMVRFMAEYAIEDPRELKGFGRLGYVFREDLSTEERYMFERVKKSEEKNI